MLWFDERFTSVTIILSKGTSDKAKMKKSVEWEGGIKPNIWVPFPVTEWDIVDPQVTYNNNNNNFKYYYGPNRIS